MGLLEYHSARFFNIDCRRACRMKPPEEAPAKTSSKIEKGAKKAHYWGSDYSVLYLLTRIGRSLRMFPQSDACTEQICSSPPPFMERGQHELPGDMHVF